MTYIWEQAWNPLPRWWSNFRSILTVPCSVNKLQFYKAKHLYQRLAVHAITGTSFVLVGCGHIWAASWENQQSECAPSEDSDQPGHPPCPIRVFAVRMQKAWVLSNPMSAQWRLWSDWIDAKADLSLRWAHTHFVGFLTRRLIFQRTFPIQHGVCL